MNEDAKKSLLRAVPHGLYVVTTGAGDAAHGFTATWLTQASFKPPMVAVAVRRDSLGFAAIARNGNFVVNFLAKDAAAVAERFFKPPKPEGGRFGELAFAPGTATGGPVLAVALGHLECAVRQVADHGDHAIVLGEVVEAARAPEGEPLVLADTPWKYGG